MKTNQYVEDLRTKSATELTQELVAAKKELFNSKFKAWVIKGIGGISIDRQSNDLGAIKASLKVLKEGRKLVIFPEGTRHHNQTMEFGEIKGGASMLAIKAKVPIIPIYINRQPKIFRKSIITIGEPFELDEFYCNYIQY